MQFEQQPPARVVFLPVTESQQTDAGPASPQPTCIVDSPADQDLSCRDLAGVFFKAGLVVGGGPGILAALEQDLVCKRKTISREKLLSIYSLGRLVPTGTMTAVAVAIGYQFRGWQGSVVAVSSLIFPSTLVILLLTAAYGSLRDGTVLRLLTATLLPAALAFILGAALRLGKSVFRPSGELVVAAGAFVAATVIDWHPFLILLTGGLVGLVLLRSKGATNARITGDRRHGN